MSSPVPLSTCSIQQKAALCPQYSPQPAEGSPAPSSARPTEIIPVPTSTHLAPQKAALCPSVPTLQKAAIMFYDPLVHGYPPSTSLRQAENQGGF